MKNISQFHVSAMKKPCLAFTLMFYSCISVAQDNATEPNSIHFSGYLESYYIHDFNNPEGSSRPSFAYSHNVVDKPSINLVFIKASLNTPRTRANLAVGSGTYMRANYASEPKDLQKLFEANVGIKLSDSNLWLDAGVLPSHIGFESAIGLDNWTVTRSILADNSPYFETGLRLSYTTDDGQWYGKWAIAKWLATHSKTRWQHHPCDWAPNYV